MTASFLAGSRLSAMAADEEFHCEVLAVTGTVTAKDADGQLRALKEGDLLSGEETVETGEESSVDIAFDKDWQNVTHVEADTHMKIATILPGRIDLQQGGIFAKLKKLPKDSNFEVMSPTAVATVRGTEYRTTFLDGQTQVYNVSSSQVFVYGFNNDGSVNRETPVVLESSKKTQVAKQGALPAAPQALTPEEQTATDTFKKHLETKIQEAQSSGRVSKIQSIADFEKKLSARKTTPVNDGELSRVTDTRRRAFKQTGSPAPPSNPPK